MTAGLRLLSLFLCLIWWPTSGAAFTFNAKVVEVVDGDTIRIERNSQINEIHLLDVDAPQIGQPFGEEARNFTASLVAGKTVTIDSVDDLWAKDILTPDGMSLKWKLVAAGMAWYTKNHQKGLFPAPGDLLAKQETKARKSRKGLWVDAAPIPPWTIHHGQEGIPEVLLPGDITSIGNSAGSSGSAKPVRRS